MKLSFESGVLKGEEEGAAEQPVAPAFSPADACAMREIASVGRIQDVIKKALLAELPRDRELKYYEPRKLQPAHINMVLDRASGLTALEIAEKAGYKSVGRVLQILAHPDAQTLLSTVLSAAADRVVDVNERLVHLAPEALNVRVELMRNSKSEMIREKVSSDILDRAGYTPKRKVEVTDSRNLTLPSAAAQRLAAAMEEACRVETVDYTKHLAESAGSETNVEPKLLSASLPSTAGHSEEGSSASPAPLPTDSVIPARKIA